MEIKLFKTLGNTNYIGVKKTLGLLFLLNSFLYSQENFKTKNNNIFLEGLGTGGYYSINCDKTIYRSINFRDFIRVGGNVRYEKMMKYAHPGKPTSYYL